MNAIEKIINSRRFYNISKNSNKRPRVEQEFLDNDDNVCSAQTGNKGLSPALSLLQRAERCINVYIIQQYQDLTGYGMWGAVG